MDQETIKRIIERSDMSKGKKDPYKNLTFDELLFTTTKEQQEETKQDMKDDYISPPPQSREDLLIQFMNTINQHYEDMKDLAYQHAKMSADLINMQLGNYNLPAQDPTLEKPTIPEEIDSDLLGGEIGDDRPT